MKRIDSFFYFFHDFSAILRQIDASEYEITYYNLVVGNTKIQITQWTLHKTDAPTKTYIIDPSNVRIGFKILCLQHTLHALQDTHGFPQFHTCKCIIVWRIAGSPPSRLNPCANSTFFMKFHEAVPVKI